jgi:hypothetical protein
MDPCWKEADRNSVACLLVPWSSRVTRLHLTRKLPPTEHRGGRLWALRLGEGIDVKCMMTAGASEPVGNHWVSYYCAHGWVLLDRPNRQHSVWTMGTARWVDGHYVLKGRKRLPAAWKPVVR